MLGRTTRLGDALLIIAILLPLLIALPRLGGIGGPPEVWLSWVGRVTGILALAMMLLAGLVSCRVPGFDRPFGGLARLWRVHHWLGFAAFVPPETGRRVRCVSGDAICARGWWLVQRFPKIRRSSASPPSPSRGGLGWG